MKRPLELKPPFDLTPAAPPPEASLLGVLGAVSPDVFGKLSPESRCALTQVNQHTRRTYPEYEQALHGAWARHGAELAAWRARRARVALGNALKMFATLDERTEVAFPKIERTLPDIRGNLRLAIRARAPVRAAFAAGATPTAGELLACVQALRVLYTSAAAEAGMLELKLSQGKRGSVWTEIYRRQNDLAQRTLALLGAGEVIARLGPATRLTITELTPPSMADWEAANPRPVPPPRPLVGPAPGPAAARRYSRRKTRRSRRTRSRSSRPRRRRTRGG
eukprot:tig00000492_g1495.t1